MLTGTVQAVRSGGQGLNLEREAVGTLMGSGGMGPRNILKFRAIVKKNSLIISIPLQMSKTAFSTEF